MGTGFEAERWGQKYFDWKAREFFTEENEGNEEAVGFWLASLGRESIIVMLCASDDIIPC